MYKTLLSILIMLAGISASYFTLAQTDTATSTVSTTTITEGNRGVTFPVAELGGCASKDECKSYCDNPTNMPVCIAFAETHGLMNKSEADRAKKFQEKLVKREGPGGCSTPEECKNFCRNIANIEACIAFAEKNNFKDRHVDEGKKLVQYLKQGGTMPGGCTDEESCETYCKDFTHAEECFAFAKKTGILKNRDGIDENRMGRFAELMKNGETPGGCTNKDACEAYCHEENNFNECIEFAKKTGLVSSEQGDRMKRIGKKGPGECDSAITCHTFCNNPANQEECFRFAKENGFIEEKHVEEAREGFVRLRQGLESAPEAVQACLKTELGETIIEDIQVGKLVPGQEIGERVRACFEKFGQRGNQGEVFKNAPPKAIACIKEKLGSNTLPTSTTQIAPETADTIRSCFQQIRLEKGIEEGDDDHEEGRPMNIIPANIFRTAPQEVQSCLKEKLGADFITIKPTTTEQNREVMETARGCFQLFKPQEMRDDDHREMQSGERGQFPGNVPNINAQQNAQGQGVPFRVLACLKSKITPELYARIARGEEVKDESIQTQIGSCYTEVNQGGVKDCGTLQTPEERQACITTQGARPQIIQPLPPIQRDFQTIRPCANKEECERLRTQTPTEPTAQPTPPPTDSTLPPPPPPTTPETQPSTSITPFEQAASIGYILYYNILEIINR